MNLHISKSKESNLFIYNTYLKENESISSIHQKT